jgi:hypothetical protein
VPLQQYASHARIDDPKQQGDLHRFLTSNRRKRESLSVHHNVIL